MLENPVVMIIVLVCGFAFGLAAGWWITRPKQTQVERWWAEREKMSPERRDWLQNRGLLPKTAVPGQDDPEYRTYMRNTRDPHENDPLW